MILTEICDFFPVGVQQILLIPEDFLLIDRAHTHAFQAGCIGLYLFHPGSHGRFHVDIHTFSSWRDGKGERSFV